MTNFRLNSHIADHIEHFWGPMPDHVKAGYATMHEANVVEHQFNGMSFEDAEQSSLDSITQAAKALCIWNMDNKAQEFFDAIERGEDPLQDLLADRRRKAKERLARLAEI